MDGAHRTAIGAGPPALHKKSWAVIDRPYSLGCATVGALYERPRCILCKAPARLFVNAENLLNISQTRYDPLVRPQQHFDGKWTVDAWTLLEGRHECGPAI